MKRFKKHYFIIAVLCALTSCKKFLDFQSPSASNIEQTFATTDNTNNEIVGIYSRAAGRSAFGANLSFIIPAGGDDFSATGNTSFDPTQNYAISNFGASSLTGSLFDTFTQLYTGIERANIAVKYIPLSAGYGSNKAVMQRYLGEALALRALFYYELIINWGDVPATFVPAADLTDQFQKNANRDSTYDHILNDLSLAESYVPYRSQLPDYGTFRLTKGAIKGLRARIALAAGGYALHGNTMTRRPDYQKYYKIAFDECNDVILSGEHGLNPIFENVFKTLHTSPTRYDDAHELMFEIAMWGGMNDSDLARSYGTQYNNSPTWGKAGGGPLAIPTYFYSFTNGTDSRRDATLCTYIVQDKDYKSVVQLTSITCAKFRKAWTSFTSASTLLTYGVNWPVIRYADVLLMYAEAANELQTSGAITSLYALQLVQKRAYGTNPLPVTPADQPGFFNAIVQERLLEFGGEGLRKYDLTRWNLLAAKIADVRVKLPFLAQGAPTIGNPYPYVSDKIYFIATPFTNKESSVEESTQNIYGGGNNVAYYTYSTTVPPGYTPVNWRSSVGKWTNGSLDPSSTYVNDPGKGFAARFEAGRSELLPYPQKVIIENRGAVLQNNGYTN